MFERLLNEELKAFVKRATDKDSRWDRNKVCTSIYFLYYVEYEEERLYWVYDYITKTTTMIYASSPSEAVRILEYNLKRIRVSSMYIRTKDGIYEVVTAERGIDNKLLYIISTSKTENTTDWVHEADVISKADTIEELCDEFVVWLDENNCHFTTANYLYIYQNRDKAKATFGAIWTDKGLIYIAKMNDKGDFELI